MKETHWDIDKSRDIVNNKRTALKTCFWTRCYVIAIILHDCKYWTISYIDEEMTSIDTNVVLQTDAQRTMNRTFGQQGSLKGNWK